jgi:hypothetical protein
MMTMQKNLVSTMWIEVIRAYTVKGEVQEVGSQWEVEKNDGLYLVSMNKVKEIEQPVQAEKPAAKAKKV